MARIGRSFPAKATVQSTRRQAASTTSGDGAAAGVAAAAGVGFETALAAGAASGIGAAAGVGRSTAVGVGASSGAGAAAGVGSSLAIGVGAAAASGAGTKAYATSIPTMWETGFSNGFVQVSNGGLTAHGNPALGTSNSVGRADGQILAGQKRYWEITIDSLVGGIAAPGIANEFANVSDGRYLGQDGAMLAYYDSGDIFTNNGVIATIGTYSVGSVIGIATDHSKFWGRVGAGNWNNDPLADPATGTGGIDITSLGGSPWYPACNVRGDDFLTGNFGGIPFAHAAPAGFSGFDVPSSIGTGAAAGGSTAAGIGAETAVGTGTAAGVGVGSGAGAGTVQAAGAAAGTGTATGVSRETAAGTGAAAASGAAAAPGVDLAIGTGAAAASSSVTGAGNTGGIGQGAAAGTGAAAGVGEADKVGVGFAAGTGTATGIGRGNVIGEGAASGSSSAAGAGRALAIGVGLASGSSAVSGVGLVFVAQPPIMFPLDPPAAFCPVRVTVIEHNTTPLGVSNFSASQIVAEYESHWEYEVTMPPLEADDGEDVISFLESLRGQVGTFPFGLPKASRPLGAARLTPGSPVADIVGGPHTDFLLAIRTGLANVPKYLKAGDQFSLGDGALRQLYRVNSDVDLFAGRATLDVWPRLTGTIVDGDSLTLFAPKGIFRLHQSFVQHDVDESGFYYIEKFSIIQSRTVQPDTGTRVRTGTGVAAGGSIVLGVRAGSQIGVGLAAANASAVGVSPHAVVGTGAAAAQSVSSAPGRALKVGVGFAHGVSIVTGFRFGSVFGVGLAAATSSAAGFVPTVLGNGAAAGIGNAIAVGRMIVRGVGAAAASSSVVGVSPGGVHAGVGAAAAHGSATGVAVAPGSIVADGTLTSLSIDGVAWTP